MHQGVIWMLCMWWNDVNLKLPTHQSKLLYDQSRDIVKGNFAAWRMRASVCVGLYCANLLPPKILPRPGSFVASPLVNISRVGWHIPTVLLRASKGFLGLLTR